MGSASHTGCNMLYALPHHSSSISNITSYSFQKLPIPKAQLYARKERPNERPHIKQETAVIRKVKDRTRHPKILTFLLSSPPDQSTFQLNSCKQLFWNVLNNQHLVLYHQGSEEWLSFLTYKVLHGLSELMLNKGPADTRNFRWFPIKTQCPAVTQWVRQLLWRTRKANP